MEEVKRVVFRTDGRDLSLDIPSGELPEGSVGSREIADGSIRQQDLSEELADKLETIGEIGVMTTDEVIDVVNQAIAQAEGTAD